MKLAAKISRTIRTQGLFNTLGIIMSQLMDYVFDLRYGTDTVMWKELKDLDIESPNKRHGNLYQGSKTGPLRKMFRLVRPMLGKDAVCLDYGSGKGKVLLIGSEFDFKALRGVEFSGELCDIARQNIKKYFNGQARNVEGEGKSGKIPAIEIYHEDAAEYEVQPEENLFFFFNPFSAEIFQQVMANVEKSLKQHPRTACVIYENPEHGETIKAVGFELHSEHKVWGNPYAIFRFNKPQDTETGA